MKVDFDSLRLKLGNSYNRLHNKVQRSKLEDDDRYLLTCELETMHNLIATLLCCYSNGEDKFEAVELDLEPIGENDD